MTTSRRHSNLGLSVVALALFMSACDNTPAGPTPVQPPPPGFVEPPPQSRTVRGFVGDTIARPLVGAKVEVLDGHEAGRVAATDDMGWFTLAGALTDSTRLRATKEGHVPATGTIAFWRRDGPADYVSIALALLATPVSLAGDYSLTFVADDACTTVPEELRTRTYAATIEPDVADPRSPAGSFLWANISGVSFLANQRRIPILIAGDVVSFWLGEHGYGAFFVEQVAPSTYLQFDGSATVSAGPSPISSLSATFEGAVDYCVMRSPMTGSHYDCDRTRAVSNVHCVSNKHRLTLTRR